VTLPKAQNIEKKEKKAGELESLILSVTPDKPTPKMFLENDEYDAADLEKKLSEELEENPGRKILLKGDASLTVMDVRKAMDIARKAKAKSIALGVEELKEE
jgi:biopolymer transport protein ExbD